MRRFLLIPALVAAVVVYAAFDQDSGLSRWWRLRGELRAAEMRIATARDEVARLTREAKGLEDDPFAIEKAIREDLGLARPGETIVRLPRASTSSPRFP